MQLLIVLNVVVNLSVVLISCRIEGYETGSMIHLLHYNFNNYHANYIDISLLLLLWVSTGDSLKNGLALTPPMGWMSWERYRCNIDCVTFPNDCISEVLYRRMADLLVSEGYAALGYNYVIVDDCWMLMERDHSGNLVPDPKRFPNGMKALADYVHNKGLLFGIYEDYGHKTCAGYPGIIGHMRQDATLFQEWGVDYVKLDGCNVEVQKMDKGYPQFGQFLQMNLTKGCKNRPIVYSCSWPVYQEEEGIMPNYTAIAKHCNLWRNYYDIQDSFSSLANIIQHFGKMQDIYVRHAGPGHWNDPDMLIIGNFGLSYEQSKLQMAMWAILAAPLIMSNDLGNMNPQYKNILQNKDAISINQDKYGIQGRRIFKNCKRRYVPLLGISLLWNQMLSSGVMRCQGTNHNIEVWVRPISPMYNHFYSYAIAFVSYRTDGMPFAFSVTLGDIGLHYPLGYIIKDIFSNSSSFLLKGAKTPMKVLVNPTGVVFHRATINTEKMTLIKSNTEYLF